jgi:dUTP pyrophosphatase
MTLVIKAKKLHPDAKIPAYAHPGDAGMDIYSLESVVIKKGDRKRLRTGISMELPEGFVALVWDKSGLATTHGLKNLGGVIDASYRGEYFVTLINLGQEDYTVEKGDKIAQVLIQKIERAEIQEVEELTDSKRGAGGFGSTGKK